MLRLENIHFSYDQKKILNGISLTIQKKEIIALIGLSGSGKTTLFRLIMGLISPERGVIEIEKKSHPEAALCATFMRQEDLLLPWRTVLGNVLLLGELGKKKSNLKALEIEALSLLKRLGLDGSENAFPHQLSGGMRQRVALARALFQKRPLLLLDEPFASLDVIIREQLYTLLREIRDQFDQTIVMVTHDFRDAIALADRILILSEGKISHILPVKEDPQILAQQIRHILLGKGSE